MIASQMTMLIIVESKAARQLLESSLDSIFQEHISSERREDPKAERRETVPTTLANAIDCRREFPS